MATSLRVSFRVENIGALGDIQKIAQEIKEVDGFVRKYWLFRPEEKKAGGFYIFNSPQAAKAFRDGPILAQIKEKTTDFDVEVLLFYFIFLFLFLFLFHFSFFFSFLLSNPLWFFVFFCFCFGFVFSPGSFGTCLI